jgi:DNA helicase-2/ATP-dependent DNA helicase PcrA
MTVDVSFSRIQAYQRCPWLYHLVYDEGWRAGPTAGMAVGQSLHRALGRFGDPKNTERSLDRLMEIFDEEWVNEGFTSPAETIERYEAGRAMLERFFDGEKSRAAKTVGTEVDFDLPFGDGFHFRGTIDRLDLLPDGRYEVVEYKTNVEGWTAERTENDLQMTLYALGMRRALKVASVDLRYQFLSNGESRAARRSDDQLAAAEALLEEIGAKIKSKSYTPNHAHCARCEFAGRCSEYRPPASGVS